MALLKSTNFRKRPLDEDDEDAPPRERKAKAHRDMVPEMGKLKNKATGKSFRISQAAALTKPKKKVVEEVVDEGKPKRKKFEPAPVEPIKTKKQKRKEMEKMPKGKPSESREVAVVVPTVRALRKAQKKLGNLPEVTDAELERSLRSRFDNKADTVLQMLDMNDTDGAVTLLARSILQTMVGLLPIVEDSVRESRGTRGVYQLNQTVGTVRELMIDIRALQDKGNLGASIVDRTLRPSYADLAVQITLAFTSLIEAAKVRMKPDDLVEFRQSVEATKHAIAQFMNTQYLEVRDQVAAALS